MKPHRKCTMHDFVSFQNHQNNDSLTTEYWQWNWKSVSQDRESDSRELERGKGTNQNLNFIKLIRHNSWNIQILWVCHRPGKVDDFNWRCHFLLVSNSTAPSLLKGRHSFFYLFFIVSSPLGQNGCVHWLVKIVCSRVWEKWWNSFKISPIGERRRRLRCVGRGSRAEQVFGDSRFLQRGGLEIESRCRTWIRYWGRGLGGCQFGVSL